MDGNADMGNAMTERFNVGGAMLLKLFGRRGEEDRLFATKAAKVRDLGVRIALITRVFGASMMLVPALATALVYGVGGHLAVDGTLTPGTLIALATLLLRLLGPLQGLSNVRIDVMTALVSFERVFEVLDLPLMIKEKPGAVALPPSAARLEFDRVAFTYPRADEISLASLETVARTESPRDRAGAQGHQLRRRPRSDDRARGALGCRQDHGHPPGRAPLRRPGRHRTSGGSGRPRRDPAVPRGRSRLRHPGRPHFHDTIRANLLFARPGATDPEIWRSLQDAQIAPLVQALPDGLDTVVGDRGYRLSGGERQRLAIARLLLKAPAIVVLDEATAHLDSESEAAVQRALDVALEGRTSLVIAHRLSTVRDADRILVLDDGRITQSGHPRRAARRRRPVRRPLPHAGSVVEVPGRPGRPHAGLLRRARARARVSTRRRDLAAWSRPRSPVAHVGHSCVVPGPGPGFHGPLA